MDINVNRYRVVDSRRSMIVGYRNTMDAAIALAQSLRDSGKYAPDRIDDRIAPFNSIKLEV